MLDVLARIDPSDPTALRNALTAHLHAVSAPASRGDRNIVAEVEAEVRADPAAHIRFDSTGLATLEAAERTFKAGRFETPRLGALRRRACLQRPPPRAGARSWCSTGRACRWGRRNDLPALRDLSWARRRAADRMRRHGQPRDDVRDGTLAEQARRVRELEGRSTIEQARPTHAAPREPRASGRGMW